jgi:hypothetical protein
MKTRHGRVGAIVLVAAMAAATNAQTPAPERLSRIEGSTFFGAMLAGKEIRRGVNATGGERLVARLGHGGALGLRGGVHGGILGLEVNILTTSNRAQVRNEYGVAFPNHAEQPLICSGDALLYPFRKAIREGKIRPYLTSGVGGMLLSVDLDNIEDKETHAGLLWNAGGGVKVFVGEGSGLFFDIRFTNHRLLGSGTTGSVDLRSLSIGVGARF